MTESLVAPRKTKKPPEPRPPTADDMLVVAYDALVHIVSGAATNPVIAAQEALAKIGDLKRVVGINEVLAPLSSSRNKQPRLVSCLDTRIELRKNRDS